MRCSRTEAPSLHRRYPASSVLRASPPPCSARPDPRGLSVGACHATGRASRVASIPLVHTCRRHYPGGTGRCSRRSLPDRWQPSPYSGRVGFRITRFEACAAFTSLRPAWSLNRPGRSLSSECFSRCRYLHRPLRLLPAGATVAGRDSHPLRNGAFHGAPEYLRYKHISNLQRANAGASEGAWRASVGSSRGIQDGGRHALAGEMVDDEHVPVVAPGTPPQRATGQRLIAVPIVGGGAAGRSVSFCCRVRLARKL